MKYAWVAASCLALLACQSNTQEKTQLKSQKDSVSYSIGMDIANSLKRQEVDIDPDVLARGLKAALTTGNKPILTDSLQQIIMTGFRTRMMAKQQATMAKQQEEMKAKGSENKTEGEAFLAENKKKEGVKTVPVTLENGTTTELQYKVIKMGTGKKPKATDKVSVQYRGTLIDGTEFDSSIKRGQPAELTVNAFIKGWGEALQLMPVGSKWMLYIPPDLGYGDRGAGGVIGPNQTLVFEVELLDIKQ